MLPCFAADAVAAPLCRATPLLKRECRCIRAPPEAQAFLRHAVYAATYDAAAATMRRHGHEAITFVTAFRLLPVAC